MKKIIRQMTITVTITVFSFVLLNLPGQNSVQVLSIHPQAIANQELYINLTPADLPQQKADSLEAPELSA